MLLFSFLAPVLKADTAQADIKLLVNQAGYDADRPKRILLQANFNPTEIQNYDIVRGNETVGSGVWRAPEEVGAWSLWYRTADLPSLPAAEYRVRVRWHGSDFLSPPFQVGIDRLLKKTAPLASHFFYAQRCGAEVPGWHAACHLDDARLPDGSHRDLTGGWHDAGDYNKYNGYTPLAVFALARFAQSQAALAVDWERYSPSPLDEAIWGGEWLRKCQDPATRKIVGRVFSGFSFWGRPENETDNIAGNADDRPLEIYEWNENEMTAAAWASLYLATGDSQWKKLALGLWEIVEAHDPGTDLTQRAKRLLAAGELYRATSEMRFILAAQRDAVDVIGRQDADGGWPLGPLAIVDYGLVAAALAEFARVFPEGPAFSSVIESLRRYLDFWASRRLKPFSIPKWSEEEIFYSSPPGEWYIGQNSMYLSQAWAGLVISKVLRPRDLRARLWATGCLGWVLGVNPLGVCLMNEAGTVHLKRYHHRYDQIPNGKSGNVPGAIANGVVRQAADLDLPYLDLEGNWWRTNEPWLPHNAYFLLALSEWATEEKPSRGNRTRGKS